MHTRVWRGIRKNSSSLTNQFGVNALPQIGQRNVISASVLALDWSLLLPLVRRVGSASSGLLALAGEAAEADASDSATVAVALAPSSAVLDGDRKTHCCRLNGTTTEAVDVAPRRRE